MKKKRKIKVKRKTGIKKNIGPIVKMIKTLDDKGLLQECMQYYIDIQNS